MIDNYYYESNHDTIEKLKTIDEEIHNEIKKEKPNGEHLTRMMYEQLLTGLYLQQVTNRI